MILPIGTASRPGRPLRGRRFAFLAAAAGLSAGFAAAAEGPAPAPGSADPERPAGQAYYVDSEGGSDESRGTSPEEAWKSVGRIHRQRLLPGDAVLFRRGRTWRGTTLAPPSAGEKGRPVTFGAYGEGAAPVLLAKGLNYGISCDKGHVAIRDLDVRDANRFGILVLAAGVEIAGCSATGAGGAGIKFEREGASGSAVGCRATGNGTGLGCGNGAGPVEVRGGEYSGNRRRGGAGDGIQVDSTAADLPGYLFEDVDCSENAISGINFKSGTGEIRRARILRNLGTGLIVQNRAKVLAMSGSVLEGNNAGENGVFQAAIESGARLVSRGNLFRNLVAEKQYAGGIGIGFDDPVRPGLAFESENDLFVQASGGEKLLYHVGLSKNAARAIVSIRHAVFHDANRDALAILDFRNGTGMDLTIENAIFHAHRCHLRYADGVTPRRIDGNCYFHPGAGPIVEAGGRSYPGTAEGLGELRRRERTDSASIVGDPRLLSPDGDGRLSPGSPAVDAGVRSDLAGDRDGNPYDERPNIGAYNTTGVPETAPRRDAPPGR